MSWARIVSLLLLTVVALASLHVRFDRIDDSLPYSSHSDEKVWATRALTILQTGDLNPHRFTKPSAHVYFMTAGFALGFVRAAASLEAEELTELGTEVCTVYAVPEAAGVAKKLYALVSVLALVLAGFLSRRLTENEAALVVAPLFVALSPGYLHFSWTYMNTNVLGAFALLATVSYPFLRRDGVATQLQAVVLGALAGLALATKYNLFVIFVSPLAYFALYHRDRFLSHGLLVVGVALATFFLCTPYALLDVPAFLSDVGREAYHYAYGHFDRSRYTFEPGWEMFQQYFAVLRESFGGPVLALSVLGLLRLAFTNPRAAAVVFPFPILFLLYMSSQATFFARNVLSLHLFVGVGATIGVVWLVDVVAGWLSSWSSVIPRPSRSRLAASALVAVAVALLLPWNAISDASSGRPEPRRSATDWLLKNAKYWEVILYERRLGLDANELREAGFEAIEFKADPEEGFTEAERLQTRDGSTLVVYPDFRQDEYAELFGDVTPLVQFGKRRVDGTTGLQCGRFSPRVKIGRL